MRFGVLLPTFRAWADAEATRELLDCAQGAGLESVWLPDRLSFPQDLGSRGNAQPLGQWMAGDAGATTDGSHPADHGVGDAFREPFTIAGFIAAAAPGLTIGTSVALLPLRNPFTLARTVATLDRLTGGRFVLGVGAGHVPGEYDLLGLDYARRLDMLEEGIATLVSLWTQPVAGFEGEFTAFSHQRMMLDVRTQPHPPVIVGGHGKRSLRIAARNGQGWVASHLMPDALGRGIEYLREQGASLPGFEVSVLVKLRLVPAPTGIGATRSESGRLTVDRAKWEEILRDYAAVGCHRVIAQLPTRDLGTMKEQLTMLTSVDAELLEARQA